MHKSTDVLSCLVGKFSREIIGVKDRGKGKGWLMYSSKAYDELLRVHDQSRSNNNRGLEHATLRHRISCNYKEKCRIARNHYVE